MSKKNQRKERIDFAINREFKKLLLFPFLIVIFLKIAPPLIKPFLNPNGNAELSSNIYDTLIKKHDIGKDERNFMILLIGLGITSLLAIQLLKLAGNEDDEKDVNPSINLISSDNRLKILLDTLFGRHQIFKNSHRNWPELQAAFAVLSSGLVFLILIQLSWAALFILSDYNSAFPIFLTESLRKYGTDSELAIKAPLTIISIYFAIYVYIKKDYADKWKYCADIYYKLNSDNSNLKKRCTLAVDILYLDLWAKRGFCGFFKDTIIKAAKNRKDWSNERKESFEKDLEDHKITSAQVEEILAYGLQNF